jgi:hypothetical protein
MLGLSGICMLEEEGRKRISFKLRDSEIAVEKNTQKRGRRCGKVLCMLTDFFSAEKMLLRGGDKSIGRSLIGGIILLIQNWGEKIADAVN